jgi:hypothetical protein
MLLNTLKVYILKFSTYSFTVEKAAFSSYVKTIKENEPVLPEHKIIDVS